MTCAFLGNPRPTVTLYKGDVNITANSKFWYNSTSGVCTIVIPTCTLKDSGEYSVLVQNELGKDRSSCALTVYGEGPRRARLGAGRRPCVPSGPEAQDGRLGGCIFSFTLPTGGVNISPTGRTRCLSPILSMSFVTCLEPPGLGVCNPSVDCSLQPLVGLDLPLKKILVIGSNPDWPGTISVAGFWKAFLCLRDFTSDSDVRPRLKAPGLG